MRLALPAATLAAAMLGAASSFVPRRAAAAAGRAAAAFAPPGAGSPRGVVRSAPAAFSAGGPHYRAACAATFSSTTALSMAEKKDEAEKKKDPPFVTWTFDEPCGSMDWTEGHPASVAVSSDVDAGLEDADLVIVGVFAPAKEKKSEEEEGDDEDNEDEEEEEAEEDEKKEEPEPVLVGKAKELDEELGGALSDLMAENYKAFKNGGKAGTSTPTLRLAGASGSKAKRYILLGMGKEDKDIEEGTMAKIGKAVASKCHKEKKVAKASLLLPEKVGSESSTLSDISAAFYSALYSDNRYRTGAKVKKAAEDLESVTLLLEGDIPDPSAAADAVQSGRKIASGVFLCKDIVNAPHNVLNSESLADTARRMAEESEGGVLTCEVLGKEECEERKMGAYLGVARGSETDPRFIHLTYRPKEGEIRKKVGIIGKGLLFDTGGYNIKTSMMELMKFDCGGAAAVLGAARAVASLAPEGVEAHFVVAACENMINQRAVVPSDVLTASNGKTIEVINTDAEGRLTLADAMVFCDKEVGCESIIELSTLTGACMVSLGKQIAGVWTSNDNLADELKDVSKTTGDKTWRMPLAKEYNEQLESKIADIKNCGTRYGGAITAALFLENFVSKKKPFAHIDIAGPVWSDKTGATGFGAKLVTEWVKRQGQEESEESD